MGTHNARAHLGHVLAVLIAVVACVILTSTRAAAAPENQPLVPANPIDLIQGTPSTPGSTLPIPAPTSPPAVDLDEHAPTPAPLDQPTASPQQDPAMPEAVPEESSATPGMDLLGGTLTDSRGNSVSKYTTAMYDGGLTNFGQKTGRLLVDLLWFGVRSVGSIAIWSLDYTLDAGWASILLAPMTAIATTLDSIIDSIGLLGLTIALGALVGSVYIARGQHGRAIGELSGSAIMIGLATTVLSTPLILLGIPGEPGVIEKAHNAGADFTAELAATDGDLDAASMSSAMVDTLIRVPHQLINYGTVIDGTSCESVYDETLGTEGAREALGDCNKDLQDYADSHAVESASFLIVGIQPVVMGFSLMSAGVVLLYMVMVLWVGWSVIKLTWQIVIGVISNGVRFEMYKSLLGFFVALIMIALTPAFIVVWMRLVALIMGPDTLPVFLPVRFYILGLLLSIAPIILLGLMIKARKRRTEAARWLSSLGGNSAPKQQHRRPIPIVIPRTNTKVIEKETTQDDQLQSPIPATLTSFQTVSEVASAPVRAQLPGAPGEGNPLPPTTPLPSGPAGGGPLPLPGGAAKSLPGPKSPFSHAPSNRLAPTPQGSKQELLRRLATTGVSVGLAAATGGSSAALGALQRGAVGYAAHELGHRIQPAPPPRNNFADGYTVHDTASGMQIMTPIRPSTSSADLRQRLGSVHA